MVRPVDAFPGGVARSGQPLLAAHTSRAPAKVQGADECRLAALLIVCRWQMGLDFTGSDEPVFTQGALQAFRQRLIARDLDRRLLERTIVRLTRVRRAIGVLVVLRRRAPPHCSHAA